MEWSADESEPLEGGARPGLGRWGAGARLEVIELHEEIARLRADAEAGWELAAAALGGASFVIGDLLEMYRPLQGFTETCILARSQTLSATSQKAI